ncbi:MAG: class I SAM-dependent methyltransferase [Dehalococcoidia bacterium]|nr:MAG: class I SAM-dependent methyltransferase [Dehalococcoidia bacterium]
MVTTEMPDTQAVREAVHQQYESFPYPARNPEDELDRLLQPTMCELPRVNAMLWGGCRVWDSAFRVMDAGCGTGDATVFMAEQLRDTGARVTALDLSAASLDITRRRLEKRGLDEVVDLIQAPIEEAPSLGLGQFDFISTAGVLHHLPSPDVGLRALRDLLKPDGGIAVMVYAQYGREPVYLMQSLLRMVAPYEFGEERRLRILKRALQALPPENRGIRGLLDTPLFRSEIARSDAGAYDLLLHSQDRAYTVPQIYEWLDGANLHLLDWGVPRVYRPQTYWPGVDVTHLPAKDMAAAAELMHGRMAKHHFFAVSTEVSLAPQPASDDLHAVPVWTAWRFDAALGQALAQPGNQLKFDLGEDRGIVLNGDALNRRLLGAVDGRRSVGAILDEVSLAVTTQKPQQILRRWVDLCEAMREIAALVLYAPAA